MGVETAGDHGGVALVSSQGETWEVNFPAGRRHLELLPAALDRLLTLAGLAPEDLGLVAVDRGPGSFTGLRIGLAFAKGVAQSLGIPLVGVEQAAVVGLPVAQWWPGRVVVWIHDRRDYLYLTWVSGDQVGNTAVVRLAEAAAKLKGRSDALVVGSGGLRFRDHIRQEAPDVRTAGGHWAYPRAAEVASQGWARYRAAGPDDPLALEPYYIQAPVGGTRRQDAESL
ncbi:MAG: tRNA (adenosine(37)-N6)-threonylcarbamoyltransferase complex dimerization subunit type 1 TsaB [Candidatus Bipolaricaulaceae bacterium]